MHAQRTRQLPPRFCYSSSSSVPLLRSLKKRAKQGHPWLSLFPFPAMASLSLSLLIHSIITHYHQWDSFKHSEGAMILGATNWFLDAFNGGRKAEQRRLPAVA